jgi:hypothetical protein
MSRRGLDRKRKVVGADGKLVAQPTEVQAKFTKFGTPIGTKAYLGYHYQVQVGPEEKQELWKTGYYVTDFRQKTGAK